MAPKERTNVPLLSNTTTASGLWLVVHRVVDVDVAVAVFDDAVGVAVPDIARQLTPVVNRLVGVLAAAENRQLAARLVLRPEDRRSRRGHRSGGDGRRRQEFASRDVAVHLEVLPSYF